MKSFLALYHPQLLEWNDQCQLHHIWERDNVARHFQLPYLEAVESASVMHLFETCMLKTASAIRGQKPLDKLLCLECAFLMNLMTRVPDNQRHLRVSTTLDMCVMILKNVSNYPRILSRNMAVPEAAPQSLIAQLLVVQVLQIIMNHFSFFGYWDMKAVSLTRDPQEILQYKSDLLRSEFLFVVDGTLLSLSTFTFSRCVLLF